MAKANKSGPKPKLSKDERRAKYTALARRKSAADRQRSVDRHAVCFQCRQRGHTVAHCPGGAASKTGAAATTTTTTTSCCYKCGSTEHSLARCPKRGDNDGSLPFATCFVCRESGHLASQCHQNSKGIYVNGGCCKECGSNRHRVTDCPERMAKKARAANQSAEDDGSADGRGYGSADDVNDLLEPPTDQVKAKSEDVPKAKGSKRRVITF